jgi:acyl carrier protein
VNDTIRTETAIRRFLKERFRDYRDDMVSTDPLQDVVDSMGLFELVTFVEQEFALSIPQSEFSPRLFATIGSIVRTVDKFGNGRTS